MPPLRQENLRRSGSGIPRSVAATPALRRPVVEETPLGKIQPVFDGFDLAENSVWLHSTSPQQSAPSGPSVPTLPTFEAYDSVPRGGTSFMGRPPRSSRKPPPPPPMFTRPVIPGDDAPGPSVFKCPTPSEHVESNETPSRRRLVAARRRELDPLPEMMPPERVAEEQQHQPEQNETVDHSRANRSVALERLRQPGKRVVIALGSGGRLLTRAERAASTDPRDLGQPERRRSALQLLKFSRKSSMSLPPVQETSIHAGDAASASEDPSLASHSGPAKLPRDSSLANLNVPPIPSSTPAPRKRSTRSAGLFFADEPTIAYPDDVSSSWISATPPRAPSPASSHEVPRRASGHNATREWASPALPNDTVEGAAEDWSLRTVTATAPDPPSLPASVPADQDEPSAETGLYEEQAQEKAEEQAEERAEERAEEDADSSYLSATSMIFNFVASLWPSTPRPTAQAGSSSLPNVPDIVETKEDKPASRPMASEGGKKVAPARKATKKPYSRQKPAPPVASRTAAPTQRPPRVASKPLPKLPSALRTAVPAPAFPAAPTNEPMARPAPPPATYRAPTAAVTSKARPPPARGPAAAAAPPPRKPVPRQPLGPVRPINADNGRPTRSAFVAEAIARLPKPGGSSAVLPVRVRDAERARDLAIKRALFDKVGDPPIAAPTLPSRQPRGPRPAPTGATPGRASRERAEARAQFDAGVAHRAAQREAREAEIAKVQADIEADLDRQNRKAAIVRANPLPSMYSRKL